MFLTPQSERCDLFQEVLSCSRFESNLHCKIDNLSCLPVTYATEKGKEALLYIVHAYSDVSAE